VFERLHPVVHSKIAMPELSWTGVAITLSGATALFQPLSLRFDFHPGNAILNTVAVEMLLYASYPLLVALRDAAGAGAVFGVAVGLYLLQVALRIAGVPPELLHSSYLEFLLYWVLGAAAAEAFARAGGRRELRRGAGATALFLALFFAWSLAVEVKGAHVVKTALLALATAALLYGLCLRESLADGKRGRALRWLSLVGDRSYSLYVVHTPVIAATIVAANWLFAAPESPWVRWAAAALVLAATESLYRGVERPSHRYALATARRIAGGA
jgi:peptidoglycan/LPS O-acetylase OafA/YrhL